MMSVILVILFRGLTLIAMTPNSTQRELNLLCRMVWVLIVFDLIKSLIKLWIMSALILSSASTQVIKKKVRL